METYKADIREVFSSIQGEGIFLGARQIFVRFNRCNLNCSYCDEPRERSPKYYSTVGLANEVKVLERIKGPHHSIALTGGEPLLYAEFLTSFLRFLKKDGFKFYLETNGTLSSELSKIISLVDIIAMDFKLPSSTGEGEFWWDHYNFLKIASRKKVFIKAVVTPDTTDADIEKAILLTKRVSAKIPLILQPVTARSPIAKKVGNERLLRFLAMATRDKLENVRVIPQVHKILNVK